MPNLKKKNRDSFASKQFSFKIVLEYRLIHCDLQQLFSTLLYTSHPVCPVHSNDFYPSIMKLCDNEKLQYLAAFALSCDFERKTINLLISKLNYRVAPVNIFIEL